MSASQPTERAIGISFSPNDGPREPEVVAESVLELYEAIGLRPRSMTLERSKTTHPRFSEKAFREAVQDPGMRTISLWPETNSGGSEVLCFLRPAHPEDPVDQEYEVRYVTFVSDRVPVSLTESVRRFLFMVASQYPLAHGSIAGYRSTKYASQECSLSGAVSALELDEATQARLHRDGMSYRRSKRMLRRLYPVTIIGPELWAKLPALPEETGTAVKVEDLGTCKMLTCWPELVEPHDPAFLKGTKALRRWIWPHTIQNPADEPDAVDRKLETTAAVIES
jgi:hypothetical protein